MIIVKKIKPLFTTVITTMDIMRDEDMILKNSGLIDGSKVKKTVKEFQRVVAIGPHVKDIEVGDLVCIDPTRFGKMVHKQGSIQEAMVKDNPVVEYNFDIIEIDGVPHLKLQDRDISYVVSEFEEFNENPVIYQDASPILS